MIDSIIYTGDRLFSTQGEGRKGSILMKALAVNVGIAMLAHVSTAALKAYNNSKARKTQNSILLRRNESINNLTGNYEKSTELPSVITPQLARKYQIELSKIVNDTIRITPVVKGQEDVKSRKIEPFIAALQLVVIKGVHIISGNSIGVDRRSFELVYDPSLANARDVIRDPFRHVIYKCPWPVHGFEVSDEYGDADADKLIAGVTKFLSMNPKYLSIRV